MKIVINGNYGGFSMSTTACELLHTAWYDDSYEVRTNPILIDRVECGLEAAEHNDLKVVEVPYCATDFIITEHDGLETCYYVLNGKIHKARRV